MNAIMNISVDRKMYGGTNMEVARIVVEVLTANGVSGMATPNYSAVKGRIEAGARVEIFDFCDDGQISEVFHELKERLGLGCCWLQVLDGQEVEYSGCILKWPGLQAPIFEEIRPAFPRDPGSPTGPGRSEMVRRAYR